MEYGQPYHEPPIPGIPMVRILDEDGKQVMQCGWYIHHQKVNYCGAFGLDLTDEQLAENTEHIVAICHQGDWNMKNDLRFVRVTPPHRIEVIDPTGPLMKFPPMKNPGWTDLQQAEKIVEEAAEALAEAKAGRVNALLEEVMDVIIACETLLRMHEAGVEHAFTQVVDKNRARGYWEE